MARPPGTGKSFALRALAWEWRDWCELHYVLDPEALFGQDPAYLVDVALGDDRLRGHRDPDAWRLLVLEDTGELLGPDTRQQAGQGLSRLLNLVDGLLGQGLRILVLVTTNEPARALHEAVVRPGRCAAQVDFRPFGAEDAARWLVANGHDGEAPAGAATLAELYGVLEGREAAPTRPVGFLAAI